MNRFLSFAGARYYAEGGWLDFRGVFSTADEAELVSLEWVTKNEEPSGGWWQVVDLEAMEVAREGTHSKPLPTNFPTMVTRYWFGMTALPGNRIY